MNGHTRDFCKNFVCNRGERVCYEYGEKGHFMRNWPKMNNKGGNAHRRAFVVRNKDAILDPSIVTSTFLINNLYVTILFDSSADKSFITPSFQ